MFLRLLVLAAIGSPANDSRGSRFWGYRFRGYRFSGYKFAANWSDYPIEMEEEEREEEKETERNE